MFAESLNDLAWFHKPTRKQIAAGTGWRNFTKTRRGGEREEVEGVEEKTALQQKNRRENS